MITEELKRNASLAYSDHRAVVIRGYPLKHMDFGNTSTFLNWSLTDLDHVYLIAAGSGAACISQPTHGALISSLFKDLNINRLLYQIVPNTYLAVCYLCRLSLL